MLSKSILSYTLIVAMTIFTLAPSTLCAPMNPPHVDDGIRATPGPPSLEHKAQAFFQDNLKHIMGSRSTPAAEDDASVSKTSGKPSLNLQNKAKSYLAFLKDNTKHLGFRPKGETEEH